MGVYRVWTDGIHMTIEREDGKPVRCGWDTLQRLKNSALGAETHAIEIFPAENHVVNEVNRRHFWVVSAEKISEFDLKRKGFR